MTGRGLINWGKHNEQPFPWRDESCSRYHSLIAEILLQRTRAEQVVDVFLEFTRVFPDAEATSNSPLADIERIVYPVGLTYRALTIHNFSKLVCKHYNGQPPNEYDELLGLPRIGQYAASAFLSFSLGKRAVILDVNTRRLYYRFFNPEFADRPKSAVFTELGDLLTPKGNSRIFNYAFLDVSRTICKKSPLHDCCP